MNTLKGIEVHYVEFLSPGTFVSESSTRKIASWDTRKAVKMAKGIEERHGAKPYGFRFLTRLEAEPVMVNGTEMKVDPKTLKTSGIHFITGKIRTAKEVLAGTDPKEDILRSNVECNKIPAVIENKNSYLTTMPFEMDSVLVDWDGNVVQEGLKGIAS